MKWLTVYGREECHLCHEMVAELEEIQANYGFSLEIVNIDKDPQLEKSYGHLVPVLVAGGEEICHYFLDRPAFDAYFAKIR